MFNEHDKEQDHYQSLLYLFHILYELKVISDRLNEPNTFRPTWDERMEYVYRLTGN